MTSEDVLKFCEKGSHEYKEVDVLQSWRCSCGGIGGKVKGYLLFQCKNCPSRWVKDI